MARKRRPPGGSSILWIVTECSERAETALLILLSFVNPFYLRQERRRKKKGTAGKNRGRSIAGNLRVTLLVEMGEKEEKSLLYVESVAP